MSKKKSSAHQPLVENVDFYWDGGLMVFTEAYHLKRGYCCGNGCRHCAYIRRKRVSVSWSGGKDCALALQEVLEDRGYTVVSLHTTINSETKRVGLHGVREELIREQAQAIGLPLHILYLPSSQSNDEYERVMSAFYQQCFDDGLHGIVFGDIFLEDLRYYREELLRPYGLKGIYPLWERSTDKVVDHFITQGFQSVVCSADGRLLKKEVVGEAIDRSFIRNLPAKVDPCGENGEFHSFVYDGPFFRKPVLFTKGEVVSRVYNYQTKEGEDLTPAASQYWFIDLLSADDKPPVTSTLL